MSSTAGTIRRARPEDHGAIMALMRASLGWPADARAEALWSWKHQQNPFGPSPVWVGETDGEVVAVRAFLRWDLCRPDGSVVRAVRAVDTATHPDHQGRGWFRRLTLHGLESLADDGIELVFNTPNDQSRPGYLKMGWVECGRLSAWMTPLSWAAPVRLTRSRVGASLWPDVTAIGVDPAVALARPEVVALAEGHVGAGLRTRPSAAFYRWRYGLDELGYRVVPAEGGFQAGWAVVRTRRRGASVERTVADVVWAEGASARPAWRAALSGRAGCDYAVAMGPRPGRRWFAVPGGGPTLVMRPVGSGSLPPVPELVLGDVELL